jgi:hypothetical protein
MKANTLGKLSGKGCQLAALNLTPLEASFEFHRSVHFTVITGKI